MTANDVGDALDLGYDEDVAALLRRLAERGVELRADNSDLVVRGRRDALDTELVGLLRTHKAALIARLTATAPAPAAPLVDLDAAALAAVTATVEGGAANLADLYPLAPLQEGVLFHHVVADRGDPYVISLGYAFDTRDRLDAYLRAFQAVLDRHDILRTAFVWSGVPEPVQVVWRRATLPVEEVPAATGDPVARLRARFDPRTDRMDLAHAPLLRVCFTEDTERGRWVLMLFMHHLLGDHTTLDVVHEEIAAHLRGDAASLPTPVPFRAYVEQVRGGLPRAEHERFFTELLGDVDEPTAPLGLTDILGDGTHIREHRRRVDPAVSARLRAGTRAHGLSVAAVSHLAWALVLARLTGRADVVFGTVLFGRMAAGDAAARSVGPFITTLPVRFTVDDSAVPDAVRTAQTMLAGVLRHEHAPLVLAQRCSAVRPPAPLFTSLLNYRHGAPRVVEQDWQGIEALHGEERTSYPLTVSVDDIGADLYLTVQVAETVDPARIGRYLQTALGALADALTDGPARGVDGIDVLPPQETTALLAADVTAVSGDETLHGLFAAQVAARPAAVAVVAGATTISYEELAARANRVAHSLLAAGVRRGDRVGVSLGRGPDLIAALLGVLRAGAAYVPLDPAYPPERLAFVTADCGLAAVVDHVPPQGPEHDPGVAVSPSDAAYVIYTSGSTGRPKGVVVEHRNVVRLFAAADPWFGFRPDDVWAWCHSFAFDFSVWEIFGALTTGGRVVVVPADVARAPAECHELVCRAGVTVLSQTPGAFRQFIAAQGDEPRAHRLRHVVLGGEALDPASLRPWFARPGNEVVRVTNMYGITETTVHVTHHEVSAADVDAGGSPIGVPLPDLRVYVLDRWGRPAPVGVVGEMYVGGAGVARGYHDRASLTGERFLPDPFVPGERLYRTGDLAVRHADGSLGYAGRNDNQVKVRGYRIEPGEVQAALTTHPGVRDAVVLGVDGALVAYVIGTATAADLRTHLAARLPEHLVPAAYVRVDRFPLTVNGKLDRAALPAPDGTAYARRDYEPPSGQAETALAEIWAELLDQDRVGRHDDFFDLGGHSLLAVALLDRLRRRGLRLDARAVFTAPVLRDLARHVHVGADPVDVPPNRIPPGCDRITPDMLPLVDLTQEEVDRVVATVAGGAANVADVYPLAPLQEGILFHHLINTDQDPFLLFSVMAMDSRERVDRYAAAVQAVIDRHDLLRTGFVWAGLPTPVQVVWRHAPLTVEDVPLDPADGDIAEQLRARYSPETTSLDVTRAPLMRLHVAHDPVNDRWVVLSVAHHLTDDNTTYRLLLGEIAAHLLHREDELPPPLPFRDFVARARTGVSTEEHEAFFQRMLGDVTEPTTPFGLREVRGHGGDTDVVTRRLDPALARRLRTGARALGVNAASLFHLAWALVLARCADRDDAVFCTVLFGRMDGGAGATRVMGVFINTLPVRIPVAGGTTGTADAVRATYALLTELLRHEHAPLALAQRCSAVPPGEPLFSALLNYRYNVSLPGSRAGQYAEANEGIEMLHARERSNYPLMLAVDDLGTEFDLTVHAQRPVDPGRVLAFVERAVEVLTAALDEDPARPVGDLDVLPPAERRLLLGEWSGTVTAYPADRCVHQLFEDRVRETPDAVALSCGDARWTYARLNAHANGLARRLAVRPQERVAVCAERGPYQVAALLAVLKAGGAYVPLDPAHPAGRLRVMLADSGCVAVLADDRGRHALGPVDLPVLDPAAPGDGGGDLDVPVGPDDLAYVVYTSGSTGVPKGVAGEHRALVNRLHWAATGLPPARVHAQKTSIGFIDAITETLAPLVTGATLQILPADVATDPARLAALLAAHPVGRITLVPSLLAALLDAGPQPLGADVVVCSGEPLPGDLVARLAAHSPATRLVNLYGSSEVAGDVTVQDPADQGGSIGWPIDNSRVYILDRHGRPAPIGVPGEIHVGGVPVARGYLGRPDLTADSFGTDPFHGGRLYRTGDRAHRRADGAIVVSGRTDRQLKIRGVRVEPAEIETRLREVVADAVVVADGDRLVAHYVAATPTAAGQLRAHVAGVLPRHLVPAAYVHYTAFPRTTSGKLDLAALRAPDVASFTTSAYVPPVGTVETTIARMWADLLGITRVGRHDRFTDLGGHSLLAVRAVARLRAAGVVVPLADLFGDLDLAAVAARVVARTPALSDRDAVPLRPGDGGRPLFLVHDGAASLLYAETLAAHLAPGLPVYGLPPVPLGDAELTTIEGMATRMVRMIRAVQPAGPYRVAGWCTGGAIAYEIATQLLGADEAVEFVGLLNTGYHVPDDTPAPHAPDPAAVVRSWLGEPDLEGSFADLVEKARAAEVLPAPLVDLANHEVAPAIRRRYLVEVAATRYVPTPIPAAVHYFAATAHDPTRPLGGWDEVLPTVRWHRVPVPGTHQSMMRPPDVHLVGAAVSTAITGARATTAPRAPALTALRTGASGVAPLVCLPGAGATVAAFRELVGELPARVPVRGFQPRGMDPGAVPHASVEAAAAAYAEELTALTTGPVHLLGHSFGGWQAHELACEFIARGGQVASVSILDSAPPAATATVVERGDLDVLLELVDTYSDMAGTRLPITAVDLAPLGADARRALLHARMVEVGLVPASSTPAVLDGPIRTFTRCARTTYAARRSHHAPTALVVVDDPGTDHAEVLRGWRRVAPATALWCGPGTHMTMLTAPHVRAVTAHLTRTVLTWP